MLAARTLKILCKEMMKVDLVIIGFGDAQS
jgi:hypothetical protein